MHLYRTMNLPSIFLQLVHPQATTGCMKLQNMKISSIGFILITPNKAISAKFVRFFTAHNHVQPVGVEERGRIKLSFSKTMLARRYAVIITRISTVKQLLV